MRASVASQPLWSERWKWRQTLESGASASANSSVTVLGSSAAECITDGENGLLCRDDADDLARVVKAALADREALAAMGQRARDTIPIPWTQLVDNVLERYRALVK